MNRSIEYDLIDTVTLHFTNGSSLYFKRKELLRLTKSVTLDISLEFAAVNIENAAAPMIITDVQGFFKLLELKL